MKAKMISASEFINEYKELKPGKYVILNLKTSRIVQVIEILAPPKDRSVILRMEMPGLNKEEI